MGRAKSFCISKREVWESFKRVRANRGSAGVDEQSIKGFEGDLRNNLYNLWNRMSSGSYFPSPVRRVEIPKGDGGKRALGIPTVVDRIAQMVVKRYLEPELEKHFHEDSYGYRPGRSAIDAVGVARKRCWRYDWVLDLDIKGFFDNIDHELLMRAVQGHTDCKWVLLYVDRWLKAPVRLADGSVEAREKGTPQGGVISPLLANLFLHYAFDEWMRRRFPGIPFERYADDVICHCASEKQAKWLQSVIECRMAECGLELHPAKTKIVYCKDEQRRGSYENEQFDFLGYTFRARRARNRWGKVFANFSPSVSRKAAKMIRVTMRGWSLQLRNTATLEELAAEVNPIVRGWLNYYGRYCKSALYPVVNHLDFVLTRWAGRKYKRLRLSRRDAWLWLKRISSQQPQLFVHWQFVPQSRAGR